MTRDSGILTVKEREAIRARNKGNVDVEALLAESDKLREMLEKGSRANKRLQKLLGEEVVKRRKLDRKCRRLVRENREML